MVMFADLHWQTFFFLLYIFNIQTWRDPFLDYDNGYNLNTYSINQDSSHHINPQWKNENTI